MDGVMFLAEVFGPFLAIVGLWMLLYGENVVKIMHSMKATPAAFYISSVLNLLIGLVIILTYNVWMWEILLAVTLLGWVMFLRGVLGLFMPQLIVKALMTKTSWMKIMGIIPFIWGLILIWAGYYS